MSAKNIPSVIYQTKKGALEIKEDLKAETLWVTQIQIADIFEKDRSVISKHINNILKDKEVEKSNVQKMHIANSDKPVHFYSLDIVLSVGYRTNSKRAIEFRKWATKTLKEHITKGYTINHNRIKTHYNEFIDAVEDIKKLLPKDSNNNIDTASILELISTFADTWLSLDAYDKDELVSTGITKEEIVLTVDQLNKALKELKLSLIKKNEATELFGRERQHSSIEGIVGNVMQSFGENDLYPTIEEKAAHLLYFMVKNHPFIDGNKRSGAYSFIWFLQKAKILSIKKITPKTLTALTLLVAESKPTNKERMIKLILQLLR